MKGTRQVPGGDRKVLYLVISGAPAPEGLPSLVTMLQAANWRVVVFSTPMGTRFADLTELEGLTGEPVRWEYRMPGTGGRTPPADDTDTRTHVTAERTMLHGLQGHCNSPIAGQCATTPDGQLALRGMVFTRDGGEFVHAMEWGPTGKPAELGAYLAGLLLRKGARDLIMGIPH
jgi:hypothetical protein